GAQPAERLGPRGDVVALDHTALERHVNHRPLLMDLHPGSPAIIAGEPKSHTAAWHATYVWIRTGGEDSRMRPSPAPANSMRHCGERLARRVLYLGRPGLLDAVDDVLRHRNVVELLSHLGALVVGPGEELERLGSGRRVLRLLVHQDPRRRRHRPGFRARLIGENDAVAGTRMPVGIGRCRREGRRRRLYTLAVLVDHLRVGQLVRLGVSVLDVADRAFGLGDVVGDAFIALGADADR